VPFGESQSKEAPRDFVQRVLVNALRMRAVIVGEDFHFGHKRGGNVALLREMAASNDFEVSPLQLVARADGVNEAVSSTAIRRALSGGDVRRAAGMLGRSHEVRGAVVQGDKRGRTIGFPTANVAVEASLCLPTDGVYAARVTIGDGSVHPAAINIGRRPTFYEHAQHSLLEAHLLDFSGDLYGQTLRVAFVEFLRGERKFAGIDELRTQLQTDIAQARAALR